MALILAAGLLASFLMCVFWMVVLRYLAGLMVWLTMVIVNVAMIGLTVYSFNMAGLLGDNKWVQVCGSVEV